MFHGMQKSWYAPDESERERQHQKTMAQREEYIKQVLNDWDEYQQVEVELQSDIVTELQRLEKLGRFHK